MGGPKRSRAVIAPRQKRELDLLKENPNALDEMTHAQIAEAVGAPNRFAVMRDLAELTQPVEMQNAEAREALRDRQRRILELIESSLIEGRVEPEIAREWRAIRKDISSLLALDEPSRSVSTRININAADPTTMGVYSRFLHECRELMPEQMEEIFQFMRRLPRHHVDMTPPRRALPEGEDVVKAAL